jgi:hypothetical protein
MRSQYLVELVMNYPFRIAKVVFPASFLLGSSINAYALELKLGQSYSDLPISQSGALTSVSPSGTHISVAHGFSDNIRVNLDYINWDDTQVVNDLTNTNIDSQSFAATASYFINDFAISANYTYWNSDYTQSLDKLTTNQSSHAPSYGLALGYGIFLNDDWVFEPTIAMQYSQWRYRTTQSDGPMLSGFLDELEDETVVISALLSASKIITLTPDTYLLAGGVVRWNEVFLGDGANLPDDLVSVAGRRSFDQTINDDFAEVSLFMTYDITANWLVELDATLAFLPQDNYPSYSWRVGYRF